MFKHEIYANANIRYSNEALLLANSIERILAEQTKRAWDKRKKSFCAPFLFVSVFLLSFAKMILERITSRNKMRTILLHQNILESVEKLNRSDIMLTSTKIAPRNTCPDVFNLRNEWMYFFFVIETLLYSSSFSVNEQLCHWTLTIELSPIVLIHFLELGNSLEIKLLQMKLKTLFWIWFEFLFEIHAYRMISCFIFHSYIFNSILNLFFV